MSVIGCHLHHMLLIWRSFRNSNKTFVPNLFYAGSFVNRSIGPWDRLQKLLKSDIGYYRNGTQRSASFAVIAGRLITVTQQPNAMCWFNTHHVTPEPRRLAMIVTRPPPTSYGNNATSTEGMVWYLHYAVATPHLGRVGRASLHWGEVTGVRTGPQIQWYLTLNKQQK